MRVRHLACRQRRYRGLVSVELALLLPLLLLLIFGVVDFGRAIQTQMILVNLSREGANLAARSNRPLAESHQEIIGSLAATTPPLDMPTRGMVYITKIMGDAQGGVVRNIVLEQYRWANHSYHPSSRVWNCGSWGNDGRCTELTTPDEAPSVPLMAGKLNDGEVIYAVESFYQFDSLFENANWSSFRVPAIGPDLRSLTVF